MGPRNVTEFLRPLDPDEEHEVLHIIHVGPLGVFVKNVGKPLNFGRDIGQTLKLGSGEQPTLILSGRDQFSAI
jgi:hypothetical protein